MKKLHKIYEAKMAVPLGNSMLRFETTLHKQSAKTDLLTVVISRGSAGPTQKYTSIINATNTLSDVQKFMQDNVLPGLKSDLMEMLSELVRSLEIQQKRDQDEL